MESLMKQDSYWYVEGEGEDALVKVLCTMCARKSKRGWFWEGRMGYGDYDLFCSSCGNAIHIRGGDGSEAGREGQEKQAAGGGVAGR